MDRTRKIVENGNIKEERLYLGGYEVYRNIVSGSIEKERTTISVNDDKKRIATVDTLTIDGGTVISNQTAIVRYQNDNHLGSASLELDQNAAIISYEEYHPFGTTSYRSGRSETEVSLKRYKYVGKERDDETGLYYSGARYYAAWLGRWASPDPEKDKKTWLTPYNYVQNSPLTRIDKDGKLDDVFVTGENPESVKKTFEQLQSGTKMKLSMDSDGKIKAEGKPQNKDDRQLLEAINDPTVKVHLGVRESNITSTGAYFTGGAFMGNKITRVEMEEVVGLKPLETIDLSYNEVNAFQEYDPKIAGTIDWFFGKPGQTVKHEITEAYEGAMISQVLGIEIQPAIRVNEQSKENPLYDVAHIRAIKPTGVPEYMFINKRGEKVPETDAFQKLYFLGDENSGKVELYKINLRKP